ncbi:MAG: hypothetical protein QHH09_04720, partial [Microgenomates group bacterium]|nr:hypothetical protein [Microgenomates group bacterium]
VVIFQPHTYSRTIKFLKQFAYSLSLADISFVLPIFSSARENSRDFHVRSTDIQKEAEKNNKNNVLALKDIKELKNNLEKNLRPNDIVFTMGAGDVYKLKDEIKKIITKLFKK